MGICGEEIDKNKKLNDRINEVQIKNSDFKPIDISINIVSPSICKIIANKFFGTGFLIKFNINNSIIFCLMTNEHILKREMVENKDDIEIKYDYERKGFYITLDNTKRIIKDFLDINIDAIIVEILPEDNIGINYFLEPEININNDIINKPIFIPQYPAGNKFCYSTGFIKKINNIEIVHNSSTICGSSGSPIFLENSIKVICIHKQGNINKKENYGNFIYPIIQELQKNNVIKKIVDKNEKNNFMSPSNPPQPDKNKKYSDYPEKIVELINKVRADPVSYADIIEDSMQYIIKEKDENNPPNERILFNKKIKAALNKGESVFKEAAQYLRSLTPLPPLEFNKDKCIPLPENEHELNDPNFFKGQVKLIRERTSVNVFFKDFIKIPEVSGLLMFVDDTNKNEGKKRLALLDKYLKYIGVTSKFIGNKFIAYFALSK